MKAVPGIRNEEQQRCVVIASQEALSGLILKKEKTVTDNSIFVNHITLKKFSMKT